MISFVQELVCELQADLDAFCSSPSSGFEASYKQIKQPEKNETTISPTTITATKNNNNDSLDLAEIQDNYSEFLKKSIYSIHLEEGKIPSLRQLQKQLDEMISGKKKWGGDDATMTMISSNKANDDLESLFIAKAVIIVYANVIEHLLMATLPLLDDIYYWGELEGSHLWTWYHLIQTAPIRAYNFSNSIYRSVITSNSKKKILDANTSTFDNNLKKYFSTGYTMIHMFPTYIHSRFSDPRSFSFLSATRYEIQYKKSVLRSLMEYQAKCLGFLVTELDFKFPEDEYDGFKSNITERTNEFVMLIERILNHIVKNDDFDIEKGTIPDIDFEKLKSEIRTMHTSLEKKNQGYGNLSTRLQSIITIQLPNYIKQCNQITSIYGCPSFLTRWWLPITISSVVTYKNREYIYKDNLVKLLDNVKITIINFFSDWIWDPIVHMMDTIRHRENRLALMGKESLNSDLESLERMVLDFARDNLQLDPGESTLLSKKVREGDLSVVLKVYEQELKKPFKSTITGHLIRTLLIQVQKTKVDLELAMAALDKLLKSNELNFAFLAVGPSLFVVYLLFNWMNKIWKDEENWVSKLQGTNAKMRESLRQIDRILVRNHGSTKLNYTAQGFLLCRVHHLRIYSSYLPSKDNLQTRFLDDLRDLDNPNFSVQQKILTCERMWRFWGFLK